MEIMNNAIFAGKKSLLLDMNSTFMFGEDRFGDAEDFSVRYRQIGGQRPRRQINQTIRAVYAYLETRYPDENYRHNFPSLTDAIMATAGETLDEDEIRSRRSPF